jgi:hypothetical protein
VVLHAPDQSALFDTGHCTGAAGLAQPITDRVGGRPVSLPSQAGRSVGELAMIVDQGTVSFPEHTGLGLIERLLDELLGKRVLNLEADQLMCNLRA